MSKILSIDTTAFSIGLALLRDGKIAVEKKIEDSGIAEHLMSNIQKLLSEEKIGFDDLDKIAIITGPGSYTGIRSGLATVIGICSGASKKILVVPISKLQVQAYFGVRHVIGAKVVDGKVISPMIFSYLSANDAEYFVSIYYARLSSECKDVIGNMGLDPIISESTLVMKNKKNGFTLYEIMSPTSVLKTEAQAFMDKLLPPLRTNDPINVATRAMDITHINYASMAAEMAEVMPGTAKINDLTPLYIKPVNAKTLAERGL